MANLTAENLQLFLIFVVPGFVSLKVYDLFVPTEKRNLKDSMIEIVSYSMINLALMSWALIPMSREGFAEIHPVRLSIGILATSLVMPTVLAYGFYRFRVSKFAKPLLLHPMPLAWDYFFGQKRRWWIIFHLKNGVDVGGIFGDVSFASAYPRPQEVYVEQVWRVDEKGRFVEKLETSAGMIIRAGECDLIEFFTLEDD